MMAAPMMDFSLAESQQAVAGLAAEVLTGADPWKELARAGLLDMSQLGVLDTAVLLTEIGKHATPDSQKALATLMTGALPVLRWGDADLQRELLPGVASGELTLTAALREPSNPAPAIPATTVERRGAGGKNHWHQDRRPPRQPVPPNPRARPPRPRPQFHDREQFASNRVPNCS